LVLFYMSLIKKFPQKSYILVRNRTLRELIRISASAHNGHYAERIISGVSQLMARRDPI
jgi:hypothetical protein